MDYTWIPTPSTASRPLSSSRPIRALVAVVALLVAVTLAVSAFSSSPVSAHSKPSRSYRASEHHHRRAAALASAQQRYLFADTNPPSRSRSVSGPESLIARLHRTEPDIETRLYNRGRSRDVIAARLLVHLGNEKQQQVSPRDTLAAHLARRRLIDHPDVMFRARDISGMAPLSHFTSRDSLAAHLARRHLVERPPQSPKSPVLMPLSRVDISSSNKISPHSRDQSSSLQYGSMSAARARINDIIHDLHLNVTVNVAYPHPVSVLTIIPSHFEHARRISVPDSFTERSRLPASIDTRA